MPHCLRLEQLLRRARSTALAGLTLALGLLLSCAGEAPVPAEQLDKAPRLVAACPPGGCKAFLPAVARNHDRRRGIGLTYGQCSDARLAGAVWQYNWTAHPPACPGVEDVPMISPSSLAKLIAGTTTLGGDSPYILGFNEPDLSGLPPAEAATLWRELETWVDATFPAGKRLVAPAPSHLNIAEDAAGHIDWLQRFYEAYQAQNGGRAPRLHALAAHCYEHPRRQNGVVQPLSFCQSVVQYYEQKAQAWGIPDGVWLTEFAFPAHCDVSCTTEAVANCDDPTYAQNPGECRCPWRIRREPDGSYAPICGGEAGCTCITKNAGDSLCTSQHDGELYYEAACHLVWPIEGQAPPCSCTTVGSATTVCLVPEACARRTSCTQSCAWSDGQEAMRLFRTWLNSRPRVSRYAWFAARIKGTEVWSNNITIANRLVSCSANILDVGCVAGDPATAEPQLTPVGETYVE